MEIISLHKNKCYLNEDMKIPEYKRPSPLFEQGLSYYHSTNISSEATGPFETNILLAPPEVWENRIYSNDPGHITNMIITPK